MSPRFPLHLDGAPLWIGLELEMPEGHRPSARTVWLSTPGQLEALADRERVSGRDCHIALAWAGTPAGGGAETRVFVFHKADDGETLADTLRHALADLQGDPLEYHYETVAQEQLARKALPLLLDAMEREAAR